MANSPKTKQKRVVLAFSGGLDTSAIVPWLLDQNYEVIAYCANLGNAPEESALRERAMVLGAKEFIFEDLRNTFCEDYIFPMMASGAIYQDDYLLGTAIARPLIAERMVAMAKKYECDFLSHGATGKGNDGLRFEKSMAYLMPEAKVIAPWRIWEYKGREDLIKYLKGKGFDFNFTEKTFSLDENILHRSSEGGVLEQISESYPFEDVIRQFDQFASASQRDSLTMEFEEGILKTVNGKSDEPYKMFDELNEFGWKQGIGIVDLVESRTNGIKSRGIYETPGGTILAYGIKQLKHLNWDRNLLDISRSLGVTMGELIYEGDWFSDSLEGIKAFTKQVSGTLTGTVEIEAIGSNMLVKSRKSKFALYDGGICSFAEDTYNINESAEGYYKTVTLVPRLVARRNLNK